MNEPILLFKMIDLFVGYFSFEISLIFLDWYVKHTIGDMLQVSYLNSLKQTVKGSQGLPVESVQTLNVYGLDGMAQGFAI